MLVLSRIGDQALGITECGATNGSGCRCVGNRNQVDGLYAHYFREWEMDGNVLVKISLGE